MAREDIDLQRFVMLNMDGEQPRPAAAHHLQGLHAAAVNRLQDELNDRAHAIAKAAAAEGSGDFVEQVSCELPLQPSPGFSVSARGSREAVPLVQRDDRRRRSGVR